MALVRDMYEGQDTRQLNDYRRKKLRDNQLDTHGDVLFKIYKPVHPPTLEDLCDLLFRPNLDPVHWMRLIRRKYDKITVQWTLRQVKGPLRNVISIYGGATELQRFCDDFQQNLEHINATANEIPIPDNNEEEAEEQIQELQARIPELEARIPELEARIQELEARIQELQMVNRLQQQ